MLKTNQEKLVKLSVMGTVDHPLKNTYRISREGEPKQVPGMCAIAYNVTVGDNAFGLIGDHIEPDVSTKNPVIDENDAYTILACSGNEAEIVTGDAKGEKGYVLGTHGGIDHVIIHFSRETKEKMAVGDKIQVKSYGQGLELLDYEDITVMNIDPNLLQKMNIKEVDGKLEVPVVCEIPACLMGSGIGSRSSYNGDCDIMSADMDLIKEYGIDKLKFGDFVLIKDQVNTFGRDYLRGATTVSIVVHSDCIIMGHGAGVATLLTCRENKLTAKIDPNANIGKYMGY